MWLSNSKKTTAQGQIKIKTIRNIEWMVW
jgi:hypothetical protein